MTMGALMQLSRFLVPSALQAERPSWSVNPHLIRRLLDFRVRYLCGKHGAKFILLPLMRHLLRSSTSGSSSDGRAHLSKSLLGKSCEQNPRASVKLVQRALSAATNFSAGIPLIAVRSWNSRGRDPQASVAKTLWNGL